MKRGLSLALAGLSLLMLTACGYREDLQRPPPMWGDARAQHDREEAERRAREEQAAQEQQPAAPQSP
jgi:predicted small lipoprotein YifL